MVNSESNVRFIGLEHLLTVLFIGLKLGHVIDWSWWWVLSPLWIPLAVVLLVAIIAGLIDMF